VFTYTPAPGATGLFTFTYTLQQDTRLGSPLMIEGQPHYYEQIILPNEVTWEQARVLAARMNYNGRNGYLATITSAAENEHIRQLITNNRWLSYSWLGGSDATQEGTWNWLTGPEAGQPFIYANWAPREPNNLGEEDYLVVNWNQGRWNDLSGVATGAMGIKSFIVEYGASGDCTPAFSATVGISITEPISSVSCRQIAVPDLITFENTTSPKTFPLQSLLSNDLQRRELESFTQPATGTLAYNATTKVFNYTPAPGTSGLFTFTYTLKEDNLLGSPLLIDGQPHYYEQIIMPNEILWEQAQAFAENRSYNGRKGYLATITSDEENQHIRQIILNNKWESFSWLGGSDAEQEGTWRWETESGSPMNYTNWAPGEPNNLGEEDYLVMSGDYGRWYDLSGRAIGAIGVKSFIVEYGTAGDCTPALSTIVGINILPTGSQLLNQSASLPSIPGYTADKTLKSLALEKGVGLAVYPNPVRDRAIIGINLKAAGSYSLDLYDIRGAKVRTIARGSAQNDGSLSVELNVAEYAKGIYLLRLVSDQGIFSKRLVIEH
jgi:hypothetical protein